ncbi:MAG: zinc ribbon domain-containing protein [Gemmatimonadales bacterium]
MLELVTGIVVAVIVLAVVLEPLLRSQGAGGGSPWDWVEDEDDLVDLEESGSAKIKALLALHEIEFDRATGKLSDDDYESLKQEYSQAALAAIKAEKAADEEKAGTDRVQPDAEAVIARARSQRSGECPTCQYTLEPGSIFCSSCGRSLVEADASPRCWVCGADRQMTASFCGECGEALVETTSRV